MANPRDEHKRRYSNRRRSSTAAFVDECPDRFRVANPLAFSLKRDFAQAERLPGTGLFLKSPAEGSFDQFPKSETVGGGVFFDLGEQGIGDLHRSFHQPESTICMGIRIWEYGRYCTGKLAAGEVTPLILSTTG